MFMLPTRTWKHSARIWTKWRTQKASVFKAKPGSLRSHPFHDVFCSDLGTRSPFSWSRLQFSMAFRRSVLRSFFSNFFCSSSSFNSCRRRRAFLIKSFLNGQRLGTESCCFLWRVLGLMPNAIICLACFLALLMNAFFLFLISFFVERFVFLEFLFSESTGSSYNVFPELYNQCIHNFSSF